MIGHRLRAVVASGVRLALDNGPVLTEARSGAGDALTNTGWLRHLDRSHLDRGLVPIG